jgi:hypothetical protein
MFPIGKCNQHETPTLLHLHCDYDLLVLLCDEVPEKIQIFMHNNAFSAAYSSHRHCYTM